MVCPWLPALNQRRPDFVNRLYNHLLGIAADSWSLYDGQTAMTGDKSLTMAEIENRLFDTAEKGLITNEEAVAIKELIEPELKDFKFDREKHLGVLNSPAFKTWHEERVAGWQCKHLQRIGLQRRLTMADLEACCAEAKKELECSDDPATLLEQRRFRFDINPPELRAIYTLAGAVISTPGNLTTITSAIKTGKSAVVGAMAAAVMASEQAKDLLGFSSSNPDGHALLHFDSEQSPDDHWYQDNRALQRAGLTEPPAWFHSYCLTGLGSQRAWACIKEATRIAAAKHGGIHSILIDGVADLVLDVNDPAECNAFVAELHGMAIERECPIIGVIHFNPGTDKSRGHLGSQIERKAETNLRLDKAERVTSIWSEKQRRAPIPKGTGPRFIWSDEAGMHVSMESQKVVEDREEKQNLSMLIEELFADRKPMRHFELIASIRRKKDKSDSTAERRIKDMLAYGLIQKVGSGDYKKGT